MGNVIEYKESKLFYYKSGTGQKCLLLFHGFGQDHTVFDSWFEVLKNDYTVYAFDHFFHGESVWNENRPLEKDDWKIILLLFFEKEKISEFEVAGFSLGGKFSLATLEIFSNRVKRIILVAPDGIKINFWYRLATYPLLMRGIFETVVAKPRFFFSFARFLQSMHIIDNYLLRFVMLQMDTEEKRKQVYAVWISFRPLNFEMKAIAQLINEGRIQLKIITGKYDKVIRASDMHRLLKFVAHGQFYEMECGHNQLIDRAALVLKDE
ncbi:MAG: hypothetical protein OJF59_002322 [Cytophagales bacterium]|jgi:pimeloyl-ACP methyl ester carboxylesterase|nr:MAG: hypothetical protein OJF59_002322 [Cytophagales bacterium]